jgi:hypothetical protein
MARAALSKDGIKTNVITENQALLFGWGLLDVEGHILDKSKGDRRKP